MDIPYSTIVDVVKNSHRIQLFADSEIKEGKRKWTEADLEKRANTVFVCEKEYVSVIFAAFYLVLTIACNSNWSGRCVTYTPEWNKCMPWSALGLSGLGSWGPSSGTLFLVA